MKTLIVRILVSLSLVSTGLAVGLVITASAAEGERGTAPTKIDPAVLSGIDLEPYGLNIPGRDATGQRFWNGANLQVSIIETKPTDTQRKGISCVRNNDRHSDEFMIVLNGMIVIIDDRTGIAHEFVAGDMLMIPKGFTGTWHDHSEFRSIAVQAVGSNPEGLRPAKCTEEDRKRGEQYKGGD